MTDTDYERVKAHVDPLFDKWRPRLKLEDWTFWLHYLREWDGDESAEMSTHAVWEYLDASIKVNCPRILRILNDGGTSDIENTVVHEMFHCVTEEMADPKQPKHVERVVTMLTKIALKAYPEAA